MGIWLEQSSESVIERLDALEAAQPGGRVLGRGSITANSTVGNGSTTGNTLAEGTVALRVMGVVIGDLPGQVEFSAPGVYTSGAPGVFRGYISRSPAGAETWTNLGAFIQANAAASASEAIFRPIALDLAPGTYDFRLTFACGTGSHIATILADDGSLSTSYGPATLTVRED